MDGHVWSQNLEGDQALGHCVLSSAFVMSRSALIVLKLWYSHGNGTIGSEFVFFWVWTQDFYIYIYTFHPWINQAISFTRNASSWLRPFQWKLMRKVTKGMRKRIKRTAIKVKMVKRTTTAGGKVSVYFDLYTYISLLLFPFQISKLAFLLCISPSDIFAKGQNYIYI